MLALRSIVICDDRAVELRQLRYAAAVARHKHFTRAARECLVAQSALSAQVRRLEAELGVALFVRTSRRVELTQAGRLVAERAGRVLAELEALQGELDELAGVVRGRVTLGSMPALGELDLPGLLVDFHALHPQVEVRLREGTAGEVVAWLQRDELDAAYASVTAEELPPELALRRLRDDELVVAAAPDDPLAALDAVDAAALRERELIAFRPDSALRQLVDRALGAAGVAPRVAFESHELETMRALASRGLGVALLPRSFAEAPGWPVAVRSLAPPVRRPVALAWRAARRRGPAAEAFLAFARGYGQTRV
jgi:DNA-binding transcriptional LysR family regulator